MQTSETCKKPAPRIAASPLEHGGHSRSEPTAALREILNASVMLRGGDFGGVHALDGKRLRFKLGSDGTAARHFMRLTDNGSNVDLTLALRRRQAIVLDAEAGLHKGTCLTTVKPMPRSVEVIPLVCSAGASVGVIAIYSRHVREPKAREASLLAILSRLAAEILARDALEAKLKEFKNVQRVVGQEFDHRVKNIITMVQAVAREMLRSSRHDSDFINGFEDRLAALSRVQHLLTGTSSKATDLQELVHVQVGLGEISSRLICRGPKLQVNHDTAFRLGLIIYELGVNSRKYGALSGDAGKIEMRWMLHNDSDRKLLTVSWIEKGGPHVLSPAGEGFGTALMRRLLSGPRQRLQLRFDPAGLDCKFQLEVR